MSGTTRIISTLKKQLRRSGVTYRELAIHLGLSESTIKQMFSSGNVSLKRLEAICDILKIEMGELIALSQRDGRTMETLGQVRKHHP